MVSASEADGSSFSAVAAGIVMPVAASVTLPEPTNSTLILLLARPGPEPTRDLPRLDGAADRHAVEHHAGARPDLLDEGEVRQFRGVAGGRESAACRCR